MTTTVSRSLSGSATVTGPVAGDPHGTSHRIFRLRNARDPREPRVRLFELVKIGPGATDKEGSPRGKVYSLFPKPPAQIHGRVENLCDSDFGAHQVF